MNIEIPNTGRAVRKALGAGFIGLSIPLFLALFFTPSGPDLLITLLIGSFFLFVGALLLWKS